jgi:hypothetical protein
MINLGKQRKFSAEKRRKKKSAIAALSFDGKIFLSMHFCSNPLYKLYPSRFLEEEGKGDKIFTKNFIKRET